VSKQNVDIVLGQFEATNRRDWTAVMAAFDEDVMLVVSSGAAPDAGVFHGREAVGRWFGDWLRAFGTDYRFEIEEARSAGDQVLVVARHHGRGRASGAEVERIAANVFSMRGTKIVRVELYGSRTEALEAVRLPA
jgi:ketosteroid isomerase-like protein